jgi:hypothetical protein
LIGARALTNDSTVWELSLDKALTATQYSLVLAAYNNTLISNIASGTTLNVLDTTLSFAFAGNATADLYVKDVYAVGVDTRTIKVYFPEAMNVADVENEGNYTVVNAANADLTSSVIKLATYDADTKTVTLTTDANFAASTTGYYLVVDNSVENALGTKTVKKDATTDIKAEFALGTATPAKVLVKSVSVTGQAITVKFNQQFKTAADVSVNAAPATELVKYLSLKVNGSTTALTAADISDVKAKLGSGANVDSSANFVDTLVITVGAGTTLVTNGQGTVELLDTATATGINGQTQDKTMAAIVFVQK